MIAVDAAHWWGPLGWLYRNTPGNIAASVLWASPVILAGAFKVRKHFRLMHAKMDHIIKHHPAIPEFKENNDDSTNDNAGAHHYTG